jgi:hypothetical protein
MPFEYGTVAEGVGFEPTETCASRLFKSRAFVRSAIPPATLGHEEPGAGPTVATGGAPWRRPVPRGALESRGLIWRIWG